MKESLFPTYLWEGDKENALIYRPVSLTSMVCNMPQKIIIKHLWWYVFMYLSIICS